MFLMIFLQYHSFNTSTGLSAERVQTGSQHEYYIRLLCVRKPVHVAVIHLSHIRITKDTQNCALWQTTKCVLHYMLHLFVQMQNKACTCCCKVLTANISPYTYCYLHTNSAALYRLSAGPAC